MALGRSTAVPPTGSKHKQRRSNRKKGSQLQKKMDTLTMEDSSPDDTVPDRTASPTAVGDSDAEDTRRDTTAPATTINTLRYPLYEEWEELEDAEAEEVAKQHKSVTDDESGWIPGLLPVKVHVASPQAGRFTREVESDIQELTSIETVKNLVSSSMGWELRRSNIDMSQCKFVGLMVYGPTTEFDAATIKGYTRGLFLHEAAFKKWWLSVCQTARKPGEMVKIAFVLWDANEATAKKDMLPDFWTNATAQVFGNHLEKLELKLLDIDVEEGCRSYAKMQKQVREARMETLRAKKERAELQIREGKLVASNPRLRKMGNRLADAIKAGTMRGATRLIDGWEQAANTKEGCDADQSIADAEEDNNEKFEVQDGQEGAGEDLRREEDGDGSEEVEEFEFDDPNDADYVG